MTAKLHEILAVEGDLDGTAKLVMDEAVATFSKKPDHFVRLERTQEMFDEDRQRENTSESKEMVTTVADKLDYLRKPIGKWWDNFVKKEATNQVAKADVVIDGQTLLTGLPATALLGLETKLKRLRAVYETIPTLQPGRNWEHDPDQGPHIYRARDDEIRSKTEKQLRFTVMVPATEQHPAQVEKTYVDAPIGTITVRAWSGMISPAEKSEFLERIDNLIRAVKKARQRANTTEAVSVKVADQLFNYIHGSK